jgi:uncharacterized protein (TIGR02677 family)
MPTVNGQHEVTTPLWRVPLELFRFATTDELYLAVMQVFGDANDRLITALNLDEVLSGLRGVGWPDQPPDQRVEDVLAKLAEWRMIDRVQNHGAHYATAAEYERKNLQYSLTKLGEAAIEGVAHTLLLLSSTGALQSAVLDAISAGLDDLQRLLADQDSDNRRVYSTLAALEGHLESLRTNTKQFNGELQRLLRDESGDLSTFDEVKQATVAYLQEFVTDLDLRRHRIVGAIERMRASGVAELHQRALAGASLPRLPGNADPAPRWLAQRGARWDGMLRWFAPPDGSAPAVDALQDIARRAIISLLRVLERHGEARRRSASMVADFRALARWFSAADSDAGAHRLFNAAFGLNPARHAHLALDDPEDVPLSSSWRQAPRVPVSPLLRTHGVSEKAGRLAAVRDITAIRRERREHALAERAEVESAWRRLATGEGQARLGDFAGLDRAGFARLLHLLGRALATRPARGGIRRATTADGQLVIILHPPTDDAIAMLKLDHGTFSGPDYQVAIRPAQAEAW